ncbi:MAG: M28 family metallopeptidase [Sphingomonadaceae bacterium]
MPRFLLPLSLLLIASGASAQTAPSPSISIDTLKNVTRTLSDDSFEGRAPATPAEEKTVTYISDRFAKARLKPGGVDGGWYQPVPLVELTATPSALRFTGGTTPLSLDYRTDMVIGTYQVQPRVEVKASDVVFVGYGINAPERGWNDYAGTDVKGKTVVILVNDPDWQTQNLKGPFEGRAMTYYGRWTYKFEEAARQGAAAAIVVHETEPAAYPFSVVISSWTGAQLQFDEPGGRMDQSKAVGWITSDAARRLFASAGKNYDKMVAAAARKNFKAVPLGLRASVAIENKIRRQESRNVIGVLPGSTRPDEYVVYSAHWDHLGRCEPVRGDDICNGAVDNASGIAGLIALAEAFKSQGAPERSILFIAVTAEESGTIGSEYYAAHPTVPLRQIVGGINMDSLNVNGATRDIVVVGGGKSELEDYLAQAAKAQNRMLKPEPTPEKGYYFRSDHFSFAKLGVPMLYTDPGEDMVEGGVAHGRALAADYTEHRYHSAKDEFDPNWDWSGAVQDLELWYRIGRDLADSDDWPNWYPSSEFRVVRDRSRGPQ